MTTNVVVGIVAGRQIDTDFLQCTVGLVSQRFGDIRGRVVVARGYAGRLDVGRNTVIESFLDDTDGDYLLMLDSDVLFQLEDYDKIVNDVTWAEDGIGMISGLYARENGTMCTFDEDHATGNMVISDPANMVGKRWYEVAGVGLGFAVVPRHVLQHLRELVPDYPLPWSDNTAVTTKGQHLSDDTSLCYRITKAGYKIYVDTTVKLGHMKLMAVYPRLPEPLELVVPEKKLVVP